MIIGLAVAAAACGSPRDANDALQVTGTAPADPDSGPGQGRDVGPVDLEPVTVFEWHLIGTWTVETARPDGGGVGETVGDSCDFDDGHRLTCRSASGEPTLDGWWLADATPVVDRDDGRDRATGLVAWIADAGDQARTAHVVLDGDRLTVGLGSDETIWIRTGDRPRGLPPAPAPSRTERALVGEWELTAAAEMGSGLLQRLPVGASCALVGDGTFSCEAEATPLTGHWWVQRGLPGIAPQLSLTTDDGARVGSSFRLEGDELELFGSAAGTWRRRS